MLGAQFKRILAHKRRTAAAILTGLVKAGELRAPPQEVEALAVNMTADRDLLALVRIRAQSAHDEDAQDERKAGRWRAAPFT